MNKRIEELAEQAETYSYNEYAKKETGYTREDFFRKKFAELIVRECAEFARQHNLKHADRSHMIHKAIEQHFGVE